MSIGFTEELQKRMAMLQNDEALDTHALVRRANLRRALQLVFLGLGDETRAGISRSTGLTAATASSLVAELLEHQLIAEGRQAASTGGKRATTLSVRGDHHLFLVAIIRPEDVDLVLVGLDGQPIESARHSYTAGTRDDVLAQTMTAIADRCGDRLLAISVQLPGTTDGRRVLQSVQLGWRDVPLAERLEGMLRVPVHIVNDVDAEAVGEALADGAAVGYRLFVHIGVGIGATVTLDGELAPGPHDRAGEIGHVQVLFGSSVRRCRCGRYGCLESAASMTAMLGDRFSEAMDAGEIGALVAASSGDALAEGARALGRAIKLIAAMLDPTEVVLGGPVSVLGESFLDRIRAELDYDASGTVPSRIRYADSRVPPYIGAAQLALSASLGVRWHSAQVLSPA